ncbi:hypothetical protein scyTo_0001958 [Scyliorhinus torazame]|uniref:IRG-type G domain-containing protein n=2 Tax=Scyliorhinus torazame TaxID=75743 RepID=A0A401PGY3_SCYTO|nr:hypothetical protein [Scyliorhinus torazame]
MEEIEQLQASYNAGGLEAVIPEIKNKLDALDDAQVNVAVAGGVGSGKSTFLRALVGLGGGEEGRVGNGDAHGEPVAFLHPIPPNVHFWEIPGIDCPDLQLSNDVKMGTAEGYDAFLIVSDCRFKGNDGEFAQAIQQEGKLLYCVQSKTDSLLPPVQMESEAFNDELQKLRLDCVGNLAAAGVTAPVVFLISAFHQDGFDFPALRLALPNHLQTMKKAAFLSSLPNVTCQIIEGKRRLLGGRVWAMAALAGVLGAVPVPGLSFATGTGLLAVGLLYLWRQLHLRDSCLQRLAAAAGKPLAALQSAIQSPGKIPRALSKILLGITAVACTVAEVKFDFTPLIVSVLGAVSSFTVTAMLLKDSLNERVKTTQRVVKTAFETN